MTTLLVSVLIIIIIAVIALIVNKMKKEDLKNVRARRYRKTPRKSQEHFRRVDGGSPGMIVLYIFLVLFFIGIFGGIWHLNSKDKTNRYWNR